MELDPNDIPAHDAKLRRLARALIADASKADDVVQRAWVAAIRERGDVRSPFSWLVGAVRKLTLEQFRFDARRSRRERDPANAQVTAPSTAEIVEREAARRAVFDAVLRLDEIYRTALVLRFFDDLPPREIARRLDTSVHTVNARIQRGLAALHGRLKHLDSSAGGSVRSTDEGTRSTLLSLVPFASGGLPVSVGIVGSFTTAILLMNLKTKITLAVVVLALAGVVIFQSRDDRDTAPDAVTAAGPSEPPLVAPTPSSSSTPTPVAPTPAERAVVDAPAPVATETAIAGPFGAAIVHVVFESDGAPAVGVSLVAYCFGDADRYAHPRRKSADATGTVSFERLPDGNVTLQSDRGGMSGFLVRRGEVTEATFQIPAGARIDGRVTDRDSQPVAGADIFLTEQLGSHEVALAARSDAAGRFSIRDVSSMHYVGARLAGYTPSRLPMVLGNPGEMVQVELVLDTPGGALEGDVIASDGVALTDAEVLFDPSNEATGIEGFGRPLMNAIPIGDAVDAAGHFRFTGLPAGRFEVKARASGRASTSERVEIVAGGTARVTIRLVPGARLAGTVIDERGQPVAGAEVQSTGRRGFDTFRSETDAAGTFAIDGLSVGDVEVTVESAERGRATSRVILVSGQETRLDVRLARGAGIRGRIFDEKGQPVAGLRIEPRPMKPEQGDPNFDEARTDATGAFELKNLRDGRFDLSIFHPESYVFPSAVEHGVIAGSNDVRITIDSSSLPSVIVTGRVLDSAGAPVAGADVTIASTAFPTAPIVSTDEETGIFRYGPTPPGEYVILVTVANHASIRTAPRRASPGETLDLGDLRLSTGRKIVATVRHTAGTNAKYLYLSAASTDLLRRFPMQLAGDVATSELLEPGNYRVTVEGSGIALGYADVVLGADADATVDVHLVGGIERVLTIAEAKPSLDARLSFRIDDAAGEALTAGQFFRQDPEETWRRQLTLAAGSYVVTLDPGGPRERRHSLVVEEGSARELTLDY